MIFKLGISFFYISVEDSNFALFNFVNEQNNEIERLQDAIDEVTFMCLLVIISSLVFMNISFPVRWLNIKHFLYHELKPTCDHSSAKFIMYKIAFTNPGNEVFV